MQVRLFGLAILLQDPSGLVLALDYLLSMAAGIAATAAVAYTWAAPAAPAVLRVACLAAAWWLTVDAWRRGRSSGGRLLGQLHHVLNPVLPPKALVPCACVEGSGRPCYGPNLLGSWLTACASSWIRDHQRQDMRFMKVHHQRIINLPKGLCTVQS